MRDYKFGKKMTQKDWQDLKSKEKWNEHQSVTTNIHLFISKNLSL